ncbi:Integrin-linked protein kinase [Geodia barretti]|uniref:Integrin-linked protein kinase n=1 Tax=Geodia barretti TaxID=519541 RepID=A0AA35T677_GEOBA|nr:Integrin-linked protein kinase [Geodia barretti]
MFCKEWCMSPDHDPQHHRPTWVHSMHYATMHGNTGIIDVFVNRGARVDIVNMGGDTLLAHCRCLRQLLKMRADVDCANEHGNTSLHYASFWISLEYILVKHGALVACLISTGTPPLSKARPRLRKKLEAMASELVRVWLSSLTRNKLGKKE